MILYDEYDIIYHIITKVTYTESAPNRRRVALLRLVLVSYPADTHGPQDDAGHAQAHLHNRQQQQAPQDLAAGAHLARAFLHTRRPVRLCLERGSASSFRANTASI